MTTNINVHVAPPVADAIEIILRSAGRAVQTEDIARRIVSEWDMSKTGVLGGALIEEAREHLGLAPLPTQSPIVDAAVDAAKPWTPESWNTCPKCKSPIEKPGGDVEFHDGDEARCIGCKTVYMVSIAEDGRTGSPGAAKPWTHPFVVGLAVDALCAFCGKTAAEHVATPETLDEPQTRAALSAVGYDDRGIEHAVSDPNGALAEVDRNLASRFARRDILRAYARGQARRGSL